MRTLRSICASLALAAVVLIAASGCGQLKRIPLPLGTTIDCLAVSDELEALIEKGTDTPAAREVAYEKVRKSSCEGAGQSFGRAAVTGRIVQQKALLAANLVRDVETYARRSRDLEPTFRDFASTRMLGTLYVLAPAALLKHGDSETGLELLETLVHDHPDVPENRLRLAEALAAAGRQDEADRAFNTMAQSEGVASAFNAYAAEDALIVTSTETVTGRPGIAARFQNWPAGARLERTPQTGRVSARGDMGWTWGTSTSTEPDGARTAGRYMTVWTRDYEGNWRYAFDAPVK